MHPLKLRFVLLLFVLLRTLNVQAQLYDSQERYHSFQFNVNEGLLQSHVSDIAIDKYNFAWLSFANGIQRFDGIGFTDIPIQKGLPDDKNCTFFELEDSTLLINHFLGLTKYDPKEASFKLVFSYPENNTEIPAILGMDKKFLYLFFKHGQLVTLNKKDFSIVSKIFLQNYYYPSDFNGYLISDLMKDRFAIVDEKRIVVFNVHTGKPVAVSQNIGVVSGTKLGFYSTSVIQFFVEENGVTVEKYWDIKSDIIISSQKLDELNSKPFRSAYLQKEKVIFQLYFNRLFKTYSDKIPARRNEIVTIQNTPITNDAVIYKLKQDHFGKLYLLTINSGFYIAMPNVYNLKYFGIPGYRQNFATAIHVDKQKNRLYVGTYGNGLLIFDTLQHLQKHIKNFPGEKISFTPAGIVPMGENKYMLMCWGNKEGWILEDDELKPKAVKVSSYGKTPLNAINYYGNTLQDEKGKWWVQTSSTLYEINEDKIIQIDLPFYLATGGAFIHHEFVSFANDRLIFTNLKTKKTRSYHLPNTGGVRCMTTRENTLCIGGNKGVFIVREDGRLLQVFNKKNGLPDECIYSIVVDKNNDLWCSSNRGLFKINQNGKITRLTKEDGLQENEFNTNVVAKANDGELYFGGVNGVSAFYPSNITSTSSPTSIFFTDIKVNNKSYTTDSMAIWNTKSLNLGYNQNSLAFNFVAQSNTIPSQFVYQYKMEGVDNEWLQNDGLQTVRYFLPPGEYDFKVYASKFFNPDATAMQSIHLKIAEPFWNTWWFMLLLGTVAVVSIYFVISQSQKAKYRKKLDILAHENELKEEREKISKDLHDSIGAYANVVLYKTELLQQENRSDEFGQLVTDLKFASKDIITSLRENIWALKQEEFTADECFLRIKSFLHAITRYYPSLNLKVKGEAPKDTKLYYRNALHVVRIIQEAVTNIIKHAEAKNILVLSSENESHWILEVMDDGKGFEPILIQKNEEGNGLINIKHRVEEAGFGYELKSSKGNGTEIRISINKK